MENRSQIFVILNQVERDSSVCRCMESNVIQVRLRFAGGIYAFANSSRHQIWLGFMAAQTCFHLNQRDCASSSRCFPNIHLLSNRMKSLLSIAGRHVSKCCVWVGNDGCPVEDVFVFHCNDCFGSGAVTDIPSVIGVKPVPRIQSWSIDRKMGPIAWMQ